MSTTPNRKASVAPMTRAIVALAPSAVAALRRAPASFAPPSQNISAAPTSAPADPSSIRKRNDRATRSMEDLPADGRVGQPGYDFAGAISRARLPPAGPALAD